MSRRWITLATASLLLAACAKPETAEQMQARMNTESAAAKTAITSMAHDYGVHMSAGHVYTVLTYFTSDAVVLPPNHAAVSGLEAIGTWMRGDPMPPGSSLTITTVDVAANGPLAVERGTYAFTMPAMGRNPAVNVTGKYLNHLHMVDGKWKIAAQIWSDDTPAMPMPTAPRS